MTPKGIGGLKPLERTGKEFPVGAIIDFPPLTQLATQFSFENLSVKNQIADGLDDFCGACSGTVLKEIQDGAVQYYPFLFAAAKAVSNDDVVAWGLSLDDVGKALCRFGVPFQSDVPKKVKDMSARKKRDFKNYPDGLKDKALPNRGGSYFYVYGPHDAYDNVRSVMHSFAQKGYQAVILIGVEFGWSLSDIVLSGTPKGYGHAMAVFGWDERGLKVLNSAGDSAGDNGFHYIPRETFNHYADTYGAIMVTDMPRTEAEKAVKIHAKPAWVRWISRLLSHLTGILKAWA